MMFHRHNREIAAEVLRRFLDGVITNDEFRDQFPISDQDQALQRIAECVWGHYSDLTSHRLTGKYTPKPESKALLERCWLFLKSDLEFEWPSLLLSFPAGLLSILTFGWVARRFGRKYELHGDFEVWPFLRKSDYERMLATSQIVRR